MKILYMSQLYPPMLYGGGEFIFAKWAEEMTKRGHEVSVVTQRICGTTKYENINGVHVYRVKPSVKYNSALYNIGISQNLGYLLNATVMAAKISSSYDLIHSNTFTPTIAAEIVARLSKLPHLPTIHDVYTQNEKGFWSKWSSQPGINILAKSAGFMIEKIILNLPFGKVHTVSLTSKNDLVKAGIAEKKIVVIPNGISPDKYKSTCSKKHLQVAYIGRLVFYKNLDTVIKAFRKVCDAKPDAKFIIAGKGPYEINLKKLTNKLGLHKNVLFLGRINDQEKIDFLTQSQIMVQPSITEGFGITVIESFSCGTPVISSDRMPLPELVKDGENGSTVPAFNSEAWAAAILHYLNNPTECVQQGKSGRRLVEKNYTIACTVDKLETLYQELCRAHN